MLYVVTTAMTTQVKVDTGDVVFIGFRALRWCSAVVIGGVVRGVGGSRQGAAGGRAGTDRGGRMGAARGRAGTYRGGLTGSARGGRADVVCGGRGRTVRRGREGTLLGDRAVADLVGREGAARDDGEATWGEGDARVAADAVGGDTTVFVLGGRTNTVVGDRAESVLVGRTICVPGGRVDVLHGWRDASRPSATVRGGGKQADRVGSYEVTSAAVNLVEDLTSGVVAVDPDRSSATLSGAEAITAVGQIFSRVTATDVRQQSGRTQDNAGELLPVGVLRLIEVFEPVRESDVFLDIGAGVGNVLAQVALMTAVSNCVGIEMRGNLCRLGLRCIQDHTEQYQLLNKVVLKIADVRDVPISSQPLMRDATLVFTNIFLFEEDAKLVVARELSTLPNVRIVVSTALFCHRHRSSCSEPFCLRWKRVREFMVPCSWKSAPHPAHVYYRIIK
ncbi:hypothetical protein DVH05_026032 [Phytophthora capsici]|nr:hypothetical protein DVH05_026032 [Phytophthora capsici]